MPPEQQAAEMLDYDRACVEDFERLDQRARRELRITYGEDTVVDVAGAAALRFNEHALHSWDTAVSIDPGARIAQGSVPLLLDNLLERRRCCACATAASTRPTPPPASR